MYTEDGESWDYVDDLPDFEQVCQDPNIAPQILAPLPPFQRPKWTDLNNPASLRNLAESRPDVISPHTDSRLWRPILDLEGILHDESESPSLPWDSHRYRMAEDWGVPYLSLGNLSGGTWSGPYRNLLTYDPVGDPHTIGFMVSASSELINDPRSGNSPSKAYLIVAVLEDRRTHISLELNLHEHMRRTRQGWELWHNGRLTAGRFGSMTRARVRQFVASHASDLVVDNEIKLGTLPADRQLTWTDLQDPLLRLARYALIRDQFRSELT
jgi:hypothetical protein